MDLFINFLNSNFEIIKSQDLRTVKFSRSNTLAAIFNCIETLIPECTSLANKFNNKSPLRGEEKGRGGRTQGLWPLAVVIDDDQRRNEGHFLQTL